MSKTKRILFIGNFLSSSKGTLNPSEGLLKLLPRDRFRILSASKHVNKVLRLADFVLKAGFYGYDAIHIDVFSGQAFQFADITSRLAKIRAKEVILNLHGGKLPEYEAEHPERVSSLLNRATKVVTPSSNIQNHLNKKGFNVSYLPNYLRIERFPYNEPSNNKKLLWVRAFSHIYRPKMAIEMMSLLRDYDPEITLTMVGPDKGMLQEVKDLIDQYGLGDRVSINGPVPNESLKELYHSHAIYLNTTAYESFGMALMEAAACGIPIVSVGVGEIPYLWKDKEEILIADGEPEALAKSVKTLLGSMDLRNGLSSKARKKAEQFTWKEIQGEWFELLGTMPIPS